LSGPGLLVQQTDHEKVNAGIAAFTEDDQDVVSYPTAEFQDLYHERWGQETFHLLLKSLLDLENWSGRTAEAVRQDFHATVFLCNLESLLTRPAQAQLDAGNAQRQHLAQVNRAVAYHALRDQVLELLYGERPVGEVLQRLQQ